MSGAEPVLVRGVLYASHTECAAALGTSHSMVGYYIERGRADEIGKNGPAPYKAKPITIRGVTYESHALAGHHIGVSQAMISKAKRGGKLDEVGLHKHRKKAQHGAV